MSDSRRLRTLYRHGVDGDQSLLLPAPEETKILAMSWSKEESPTGYPAWSSYAYRWCRGMVEVRHDE
jgi:hypothetical protein